MCRPRFGSSLAASPGGSKPAARRSRTMRGSKQDVPVAFDGMGVLLREVEWGAMNVGLERFPAGADTAPVFKGLPDDRCQCPHWGYVIKGQLRVRYEDHEETLRTGD